MGQAAVYTDISANIQLLMMQTVIIRMARNSLLFNLRIAKTSFCKIYSDRRRTPCACAAV